MTLDELPLGKSCYIDCLTADDEVRRRLLDLGLTRGARVYALHRSPAGDPTAYGVRGVVIAIRCEDAREIIIRIEG